MSKVFSGSFSFIDYLYSYEVQQTKKINKSVRSVSNYQYLTKGLHLQEVYFIYALVSTLALLTPDKVKLLATDTSVSEKSVI